MRIPVVLGFVLFGVWLLWSGHWTTLLVSLGIVSTLLVLAIARRMGVVDDEGAPLNLPPRAFVFLPWMFWEVAKANVHVASCILRRRMPIHPHLIRVRAGQRSDLGRVIYANCITLTPGTVSVELEGDVITVHALTRDAAEGLASGEMDRKVTAYEGKS